jgi:hypothetical protein
VIALLFACGPKDAATTDGPAGTAGEEGPAYLARPVSEPSGTCPGFKKRGLDSMRVDGESRDVWAFWPNELPSEPMGVVFAWHGLGDNAENFAAGLDLEGLAKRNDVLVLAPSSADPFLYTWDYVNAGGNDIVMYEDLRACAAAAFDIDLDRITSLGFSYGALWTSWLTMLHSDTLAASLVLSGGTGQSVGLPYLAPSTPIPVLGNWGGASDLFDAGFVVVNFAETMADFLGNLESDGHVAIGCDHGRGHSVPPEFDDQVDAFLMAHRFGEESPFAGGGTKGLPDYCVY